MAYKVYLKKNEEKRILGGHPWVYANEVMKTDGKDKNGSIAEVYANDGRYVGKGLINHLSKIYVRIITRRNEEIDRAFFLHKILQAKAYRENLGYSNCYRAVFGESDGLPGLIVDKYADILSVQILSLGMDNLKEMLISILAEVFSPRGIYERSDVSVRLKEGLTEFKGKIYGEFDTKVEIEENGLKMIVDVENGQKTGYYLDQKENRFALRKYVKGKTVLDCFCNSGGFSLNAAAGGALKVTAADISETALKNVRENAALNGFDSIDTVAADVFDLLRNYRRDKRTFDVVVLDPPAFTKSADTVKEAYKGYKDINLNALKIVAEGGFLISCSCSNHMSEQMFEKMLTEAAIDSGRTVRIVEKRTQSTDHPSLLSAEETQYLKFSVLHVR